MFSFTRIHIFLKKSKKSLSSWSRRRMVEWFSWCLRGKITTAWNRASGIFTRFVGRMRQKLLQWRPQYRTVIAVTRDNQNFEFGTKRVFPWKLWPVFAGYSRNWKFQQKIVNGTNVGRACLFILWATRYLKLYTRLKNGLLISRCKILTNKRHDVCETCIHIEQLK